MTDSRLSPAAWRNLLTNSSIRFSGTITLLETLPASAGTSASGAASAETAKPAPSSSASKAASTPAAATTAAGEQHPEQQGTAERRRDQKQENDDSDDPHRERELPLIVLTGRRARRQSVGELHSCILRDDFGYAGGDERNCPVVVSLPEKRDCFASEAADFAVGKNAFQSVANRRPVLVILDCIKDKDAAIAS